MKPSEWKNKPGEDMQKFLKQLNTDPQLLAILNDDPTQRISRRQARALGEHDADALRDKIFEKRKEIEEFRNFTCGKWVHTKLKEHFPEWLFNHTLKHGPKLSRMFGWYFGSDHGPKFAAIEGHMPKMYPSTRVFLARKRFRFFLPFIADNKIKFSLYGPLLLVQEQVFHWNEQEDA